MPSAATLFQRNKQLYVEEEKKLVRIISDASFLQVFQNWLNSSISQLDAQHERCEQQLSELQQNVAVEEGKFWCSKTIIEHCNLHLSERRLVNKKECLEKHAKLPELIQFVSCLQQLKSVPFMTTKQRQFLEQVEEELQHIILTPRELTFITNALMTKLKDNENTRKVFGDLTSFQNTIEDLSPDIDQCEQLLEASIENGEMGLAEDVSRRQLEIYEHILKLITDQYPALSHYFSESNNSERGRRWAIFRMVDKDITVVIDEKHRQIEACEEDLLKVRDQLQNYAKDDMEQRKRYEKDRGESNQFLQENKEKQQSVWNRIFEIFKELEGCTTELSTLAAQRRKEVDRRLQLEEREAGRRSGHDSFIQAAAMHAQKLQDTIGNAEAIRDFAKALNLFALDGCETITAKYDKHQNTLGEMLRLIQEHHFRRFSDYYIAASRYLYRKERRLEQLEAELDKNDMQRELHAESMNPEAKRYAEANTTLALQRREVAQEVLHLRHKLEKMEKSIGPTLRSLDFAGVAYTHPREIAFQMNLNRWSTMVDLREMVNPSIPPLERIRREELDTLRKLRAFVERDAEGGGGGGAAAATGASSTTSMANRMANAEDGEEEEQDDRRSGGFHYPYGKKANTSGPRLIAGGAAGRGGGVGAGTTTTTTATPAGAGGSGEMEEHSWMSIPVKGGGGGGWGWGSIRASPSKPGSSGGETRGTLAATSANRNTLSTNPTGGSSSGGWRQGLPYASKEGSSTPSTLVDRVHALVSKSFPEDGREAAAASRLALPPVDGTEEEKRRRWKRGGGEGGAGTSSFPTAGGARSTAKASPPALPTRMEGATFRALYPYKARAADELSFEVHSKIVCISRAPEEGWFKGVCNQRTGLFPINYVEPCPEDDD